jgi:hypothetical protein
MAALLLNEITHIQISNTMSILGVKGKCNCRATDVKATF